MDEPHDKTEMDQTVVSKEQQEKLRRWVDKVASTRRSCPKCDGPTVHTRLYGYRCARGCS